MNFKYMSKSFSTVANHTIFAVLIPLALLSVGQMLDRNLGYGVTSVDWLRSYSTIFAIPILATGVLLRIWSEYYLLIIGKGDSFTSPAMRAKSAPMSLVNGGPYSYCRNPMVLGAFLITLFAMLFEFTLAGLIFIFPAYILLWTIYIKYYEEPFLKMKFCHVYIAYQNGTPRFLRWRWSLE